MSALRYPASGKGHRIRRRMLLVLMLAVALSLACVQIPQARAQSPTVSGEIMNGTPGGTVPGDLAVTLHIFSEMEEINTYTTTVTGGQSFHFDAVTLEEGNTAVARTAYDGVTYVSEFATIEETEEDVSLPLTIYETTTDPANVDIFQLHVFVNRVSEQIQLGAYAVIGNTGSRTYVGSRASTSDGATESAQRTWSVELPDGAENLQFEGGELGGRFISLEGGFADTRPIPPGNAGVETSFTYELPFQEGIEIRQSFDVPVRSAVLVLPEGDWALEGASISSQGTLETQMGTALSYSAGPLEADEPLAFTLVPRTLETSRPPDGSGGASENGLVVGLGALVIAGVAITWMWRSPSTSPMPVEVQSEIEAIAALDRDFENGKLPEASYRKKRRRLRDQVREHVLTHMRETVSDQGQ